MDSARRLARFAERFAADSAQGDWQSVRRLDRELAALLRRLAAKQPLSAAERAALNALRAAHETARARCARATTQLGDKLSHMRTHKDGWMAYAMNDVVEER
ncbi:MAG: hypothetical protein DIU71_16105 [Proteobacteria bacterium]|nr:MAG: hypothetical protein DIU71_16105 [Pseudomonadota bacterium]